MEKQFLGKCPMQNSHYCISVRYIESSSNEGRSFEKGTFKCDYRIFGGKCSVSCPIYASAPDRLL